jgi:hypothetical protein
VGPRAVLDAMVKRNVMTGNQNLKTLGDLQRKMFVTSFIYVLELVRNLLGFKDKWTLCYRVTHACRVRGD